MTTPTKPVEPLDEWFYAQQGGLPPSGGVPYLERLNNVRNYLEKDIYPHINMGELQRGGGLLTDHGTQHILTVIRRASELLSYPPDRYPQLSRYEVYLLLMAIHFHDVGNIYGRTRHEARSIEIIEHIRSLLRCEILELQAIRRIAAAHGGTHNGNTDTISILPKRESILGVPVRYQLLAAILRFADELADDTTRAARALQELDMIPTQSKAYHEYSRSLQSVYVDPASHSIELRYVLTRNQATRKYGKGLKHVFLLDEIYSRTLKMHYEREYCMRFAPEIVRLFAIDVSISVVKDQKSIHPTIDPIGYRLPPDGHPSVHGLSILDYLPELPYDGQKLADRLK